jgi:hypothetical protein
VIAHPFDGLPSRSKAPTSKRDLDAWVSQAAVRTGIVERRVSWLVASAVVLAILQRATNDASEPLFLLSGGVQMEMRMGLEARATKDVDTIFRGEFGDFVDALDSCLGRWDPFEFGRTAPIEIPLAQRLTKPNRVTIQISINGRIWRSIALEVAPDEGLLGKQVDSVSGPPLSHFGLPEISGIAVISVEYQIAQKLHACTGSHVHGAVSNRRVQDVLDISLLRERYFTARSDLCGLRDACVDIFSSRNAELQSQNFVMRSWPPLMIAHEHWRIEFNRLASEFGLAMSLDQAVANLNDWVSEIAGTR